MRGAPHVLQAPLSADDERAAFPLSRLKVQLLRAHTMSSSRGHADVSSIVLALADQEGYPPNGKLTDAIVMFFFKRYSTVEPVISGACETLHTKQACQ